MLPLTSKIVVPLLLVGLVGTHTWAYTAGVQRQKDRHAEAMLKLERSYVAKLQERIDQNEKQAEKYQEAQTHADLEYQDALAEIERLRRHTAQLGRLRDPGRTATCRTSVPASAETAGRTADSTAGSELSAEATEFLHTLAADADRAAAYAQACHGWVIQTN